MSCVWLSFNIDDDHVSLPNSIWLYSVGHLREQEFWEISFKSTVAAMGGPLSSVRPKRKQMNWL